MDPDRAVVGRLMIGRCAAKRMQVTCQNGLSAARVDRAESGIRKRAPPLASDKSEAQERGTRERHKREAQERGTKVKCMLVSGPI